MCIFDMSISWYLRIPGAKVLPLSSVLDFFKLQFKPRSRIYVPYRASVTFVNILQELISIWTVTVRPAQRTIKHVPIRVHADRRAPKTRQPRATERARATRSDAAAYPATDPRLATSHGPSGPFTNTAQPSISRISCERLHRNTLNCK